ncbi:hypothetical protein BC835DRAFT_1365422 [Cytidiella melzeri]|nr:hypothetical protein BC835DRAFT_1365422 [Cytidiella melzeri]
MASPVIPPTTPPVSPPSRPSSPSPSRSGLRTLARMGTMLRRNSSGFGFGRQSLSRSQSKSSLRGKEASSDEATALPSPVAESPVREAQANATETSVQAEPSPLSQEIKTAADASPAPVAVPPLTAEPEPVVTSTPQQAEVASEPATEKESVPVSEVASATVAPEPAPEKRVVVVSPSEEVVASPNYISNSIEATGPTPPPATEERAPDYFAWSDMPEIAKKKPSASSLAADKPAPTVAAPEPPADVYASAPTQLPVTAAQEAEPVSQVVPPPQVQQAPVDPYAASAADSFAWKDDAYVPKAVGKQPSREQFVASPEQTTITLSRPPSREVLAASPRSVAITLSPKASKSSLASSYGQVASASSGRRRVSVSLDPEEGKRGRSSSRQSIRIQFEDNYADPFADPPVSNQMAVPKHALSPIYSVNFPDSTEVTPAPMTEAPESVFFPQPGTQAASEKMPTPISMPLPSLNEVSASRTIREVPSAYSIGQSTTGPVDHAPRETDERLPLLPRGMPVPDIGASKAPVEPLAFNDIDITIHQSRGMPWPSMDRSYKTLGWVEHLLPDSSLYYSHRNLRVVTEVDLRNAKKLEAVSQYLDKKRPSEPALPPPGWELWLRDNSKLAFDFIPVQCWISHKDRILTMDPPMTPAGEIVAGLSDDDRVDVEYRYWTYVESHPAHEPLPANAHAEALDALTWCYTECLLPSERTVPPAFTPQECQELMTLLKAGSNGSPGNTIVHNRIVARVLLRQAQWRQHYFRPAKPLPNEFSKGPVPQSANRRMTFRRAVLDVVMSILCLGIPYLFMDRSNRHRVDEESGLRSQGPFLIISSCACLVAAVILSASVTLLTLPGLDDLARLAGMIAILFSASSMVSSVVALFKFKADMERTVVYVGGEGLMILSKRSIVMSLPVVFLAWAIAAFVTGITFYSFRGVTLTSKAIVTQPFVDYTHWVVVGGLGALAGILLVTVFAARR